jgi:iron-sulfur cluster assembly protein
MLFISDAAKSQIDKLKVKDSLTEAHFIRVSVLAGGCSGFTYDMKFDDQPKPDDQVFEDKGIKLVTDLKSFLYVFNTTLDFSDGLEGKGFYFVNPNASRTCACGESFAV